MTKLEFNNIVVRHKGRTISIGLHWSRTAEGDFVNAHEIAGLGVLDDGDCYRFRFCGTGEGIL